MTRNDYVPKQNISVKTRMFYRSLRCLAYMKTARVSRLLLPSICADVPHHLPLRSSPVHSEDRAKEMTS